MTNEEVVKYIKTLDGYNENIKIADLIFLGGSRAYGLEREKSDYDIIMYSSKAYYIDNIKVPNDKNLHMHVMVYPTQMFFDEVCKNKRKPLFYMFGWGTFIFKEKNIIYSNQKGKEILNFCITHLDQIHNINIYCFLQRGSSKLIEYNIESLGQEGNNFIPKIRYYGLCIGGILTKDDNLKSYINISNSKILINGNDSQKEYLQNILLQIKNFYYSYNNKIQKGENYGSKIY